MEHSKFAEKKYVLIIIIYSFLKYISGGRGGPMRGQPPYGRGPAGGYNRDPYPPPPPPSYMRDRMDGYVSFEIIYHIILY